MVARLVNFINPKLLLNILEVIILASIFYWFYLLIKGTRAIQVAKGIVVLVLATFIAKWFHLNTISWVLGSISLFIPIVLTILFAPELRRALAQMGQRGFLHPFLKEEEEERKAFIDEIVRSTKRLAESKIGALLVIERQTGLENFIESGIKINGRLTSELLHSILRPPGPLHDGAVIIRNRGIAAASCTLPLTSNPDVYKGLGMRHRAAIGLSEEADAVVIVVSEETGKVSLVVDGKRTQNIELSTLKKQLKDLLEPAGRLRA